ncbi:LIC12162 family protein [Gammaproteobacteria bacterium]|nr:LIC12162 family protein [Gammaproteobacteria bacterium]
MTKKPRHLILSSDKKIWKINQPTLFLGEWCCLYETRHIWKNMDAVIAKPYGLSKQSKDRDFNRSQEISDNFFEILINILNEYHCTNYDKRYWNIVLGHWFKRYINVMINRISTIDQCIEEYDISGCSLFTDDNYVLATEDTNSSQWAFSDDQWNGVLYKKILMYFKFEFKINYVPRNTVNRFLFKGLNYPRPLYKKVLNLLKDKIVRSCRLFVKDNDSLILNTYLGLLNEFKLQLKMGQFPQLWSNKNIKFSSTPDINLRESLKDKVNNKADKVDKLDKVDKIIYEMVFDVIPICFLEGYKELDNLVNGMSWPINPKLIFTSNAFDTDEVFKFWTASKVAKGSKYIVGQHGNNYGTSFYANPTIEEVTSDIFLTWGWSDKLKQHKPSFVLKKLNFKYNKYNNKGGLIFVQDMLHHREDTWDRIAEHRKYFTNQVSFYNLLASNVKSNLTIRLFHAHKYNNPFEADMWREVNSKINIDLGDSKLEKIIPQNRLTVFSYDSTGVLELLSKNIPVIAFWDNDLDHVRDSAMPHYKKLLEAEIIHLSAESAAEKVNKVWDDVDSWWNDASVQSARISFCNRYAVESKNKVSNLISHIKKEIL